MTAHSHVYIFDAYGTLFDVHSAARAHAASLGDDWLRVSEAWRAKQLEYTWVYSSARQMRSFRDVTRESLLTALTAAGSDVAAAESLLNSYRRLAPFTEVESVLAALRERGDRLAILSNADQDMLEELVLAAGFVGIFDHLISVAGAEAYKPAPEVYKLAVDSLGIAAQEVHFVSSNRWDIAGAKAFGFKTVWINRRRQPDEYRDFVADQAFEDLRGLLAQ
ncbi:MAG: haloacid dehalogenase type II [Hyphomicrobium sp.]